MTGLEISKNDVYETGLKYDYVKEKLENHKDLKDLYNQVLWLDDKENKKIEDLSGVKTYFESITKTWEEYDWNKIKKEWATWSFAVQLFLKSQGLYNGRIDWLYMTAWQPESKTRAAVRKFQEANWLLKDGWAWPETIKKMLEKLDVKPANPETDMNKILENLEIADAYKKLNSIFQWQFRDWQYVIETKDYHYKMIDGQLTRKGNVKPLLIIIEEVLLVDWKWWKKEIPVIKKEVPGTTPGETEVPVAKKVEEEKVEDLEKTNKTLLESKISGLDFNWLGVDEKKSKELFIGRITSILSDLKLSFTDLTSEHINWLFTYLRKEKVIWSRLAWAAYQDNIDYWITKTNSISAESIQKKKMEQNQKVESLIKDYFSKITLEK